MALTSLRILPLFYITNEEVLAVGGNKFCPTKILGFPKCVLDSYVFVLKLIERNQTGKCIKMTLLSNILFDHNNLAFRIVDVTKETTFDNGLTIEVYIAKAITRYNQFDSTNQTFSSENNNES
jgi:hypothetical protein